jgi:hypothetical protein
LFFLTGLLATGDWRSGLVRVDDTEVLLRGIYFPAEVIRSFAELDQLVFGHSVGIDDLPGADVADVVSISGMENRLRKGYLIGAVQFFYDFAFVGVEDALDRIELHTVPGLKLLK